MATTATTATVGAPPPAAAAAVASTPTIPSITPVRTIIEYFEASSSSSTTQPHCRRRCRQENVLIHNDEKEDDDEQDDDDDTDDPSTASSSCPSSSLPLPPSEDDEPDAQDGDDDDDDDDDEDGVLRRPYYIVPPPTATATATATIADVNRPRRPRRLLPPATKQKMPRRGGGGSIQSDADSTAEDHRQRQRPRRQWRWTPPTPSKTKRDIDGHDDTAAEDRQRQRPRRQWRWTPPTPSKTKRDIDGHEDTTMDDRHRQRQRCRPRCQLLWILVLTIMVLLACSLVAVLHYTSAEGLLSLFVPPTDRPSAAPTTSLAPSAPSTAPSAPPSTVPSGAPSWGPTRAPTFPYYTPPPPKTSTTTQGYFNYDPEDDQYGPSRWENIQTEHHWLREFTNATGFGPWRGWLNDKDPLKNRCGQSEEKQSPKDLRSTAEGDLCEAHHEIRTKCGTNGIDFEGYKRLILPHKLSLVMNRRECVDEDTEDNDNCDFNRPPLADFPKYASTASSYSDLLHVDIKLPGEHQIEGEHFDAELQLIHTHYGKGRIGAIGIPVRAVRQGGFNSEFQRLIDQFQQVYDHDWTACEARKKKKRYLRDPTTSNGATASLFDFRQEFITHVDDEDNIDGIDYYNNRNSTMGRRTMQEEEQEQKEEIVEEKIPPSQLPPTQFTNYDPYSDAFMPGMYFYRYDGSLTEPPCLFITWWVMNEPAIISMVQLGQMKAILFTHVDEKCRETSVHNKDQSVARPIFPNNRSDGKGIEKCVGNFISDASKGRQAGKMCKRY